MIVRQRLIASAIVVALLQIAFLSWMIAGRAMTLRNGQDVLLKVEPVDPRDLLRGDYVQLGYDISTIPEKIVENMPEDPQTVAAGPIYVRINKDADGFWRPVSASLGQPSTTARREGEIDIRGNVLSRWGDDVLRVTYGIERFYLPEDEGKAIERDMRVRSFGIVASIDADGTAQIKALMDGETKLFEEPPY
ncbi:GDYXXLXY domain-containing protein [Pseudaminobacter sp. NGMCC 1.201702]|uniref:GDYXXLXY domain-containing protein n=1 Tax=Pseudaminobacter sp. NGMCC 1.201702 TaxID=3391825 RepID=UPI0039EF3E07